jgi:hypothetical protein
MAIERHMFLNYAEETISVEITSYENVQVFEMLVEGDVEDEVSLETSSPWTLRVPAGAVWGFAVENGVSYTNPNETDLKIYVGDGKNPWPPPPPPPPLFAEVEDFDDRFEDFLMALGAAAPEKAAEAPAAAAPGGA